MDPCENQDQNHHHHQQQQQQQQLQLLQQREWLSCSTSSRPGQMDPELQEVTIEDENGCENVEKGGGYGVVVVEREHMFDKVVTPSDVGKLNRLVIPKQHAEKYFPLDSTNNNSSSGNNNNEINNNNNKAGLLLNFEDRTGKSWRFRYSYWNSSQSYVMTKGWSRFVKEKQLSAGDIVSFQRAVGDDVLSKNTFFIDWRRRPPDHHQYHHHHHHHLGTAFSVHHSLPGWRISNSNSSSSNSSSIIPSPSTSPTFFLRSHPHESHPHHHHNNNNSNNNYALWDHSSSYNNVTHLSMVPYAYGGSGTTSVVNPSGSLILLRSPVPNPSAINHPQLVPNYPRYLSGSSSTTPASSTTFQGGTRLFEPKVYDSVPVVHGKTPAPQPDGGGAAKRSLRLFGVNMEYDHHHLQLNGSMGTSTTLSPPSTSNFKAQQN